MPNIERSDARKEAADNRTSNRILSRSGVPVSPIKRSQTASLIVNAQTCGWDPTEIVGAENLIPTMDSPNGMGKMLPDTSFVPTFNKPEMQAPDIPNQKASLGDPYAGKGKF